MSILQKLFKTKEKEAEKSANNQESVKDYDLKDEISKKSLSNRKLEENLRNYNIKQKQKEEKYLKERLEEIFPRKISDIVAVDKAGNTINYAMDGMNNALANPNNCYCLTNTIIDRMTTPFIGWSQCAIIAQNWLVSRALTIPANDAISAGWRINLIDDEEAEDIQEQNEKEYFIKQLAEDEKDFGIAEVCKKANYLKKCFGYCLVVPVVEGADMSKPFNLDGISKNSYKGLSVIEPMWITPQFDENSRNPLNKDFYEPSSYMVAGNNFAIHKSWVIKLINASVPDVLKPVYYWGGIPLTQMIFERVYCAERVANEAPMLAMSKRMYHIEGDLENAIANPELFNQRMNFFVENQDNFGVAVIPQDSNIGKMETSLTDFDQLIMTQYQLVSSIAQLPVTKLMKIQLKGFDSAGHYEQDDYNQTLIEIQENDYTKIIELHNKLICRSKYGKDMKFNIIFNEIDSPTAKESSEIRLLDAKRDVELVRIGILTREEVREKLRNDEDSLYNTITDENFTYTVNEINKNDYIENEKIINEEIVEKKQEEIM
jgi:hypothetical protein